MSLRVEWFNVEHPFFSLDVEPRGSEVGYHEIDEEVGLVITGDEAAVIEGPAPILRAKLRAALAELDRLFPEEAPTRISERHESVTPADWNAGYRGD